MSNNDLVRLHKLSKQWFCEKALPFWIERACAGVGGQYERLLSHGEVDLNIHVRTRVQFRQIYTFAMAYEKDWLPSGLKHALAAQNFVHNKLESTDTRFRYLSYPHLLNHDFSLCDERRDLYDHAFCLLSLAALFKATHNPTFLETAQKVFSFIDSTWSSADGGWFEGEVQSTYRTQNTHMHLFEAFLTWYDISLDAIWLERAQTILALFCAHFYQPALGVVFEYFEQDWHPLESKSIPTSRQIVEPGHMFEWVYLLRWYQGIRPNPALCEMANILYRQASHLGVERNSGLVFDQLNAHCKVLQPSKRLWPMLEYLKASLAQAKFYKSHPSVISKLKDSDYSVSAFEQNASAAINSIYQYFIQPAHRPGMFVDQVDQDNQVINDHLLGSTFYHLITALVSLEDYCEQQAPMTYGRQPVKQQKKECDVYL